MAPSIERAVIDQSAGADLPEPATIRTLVHKRYLENVFLTGFRAWAEDHFVCTGRFPTAHLLFNDGGRIPHEDILFYTEVGRQASLAVSHAFLNVGLEDVFIFERSQAAVTEAIWRLPSTVDSVEIEIKVREIVRRKGVVSRIVADHSMTVAGQHVFAGTGRWTVQPAAVFKRLRRGAVEVSAPEQEGSRGGAASNRIISWLDSRRDGAVHAALVVDPTHPFFFDHACDHVPGMLLLEAFAQLSLGVGASAGPESPRLAVMAYEADFTQFVECNLPISLTARPGPDMSAAAGTLPTTAIVVEQRDVVAGAATVRVGVPA
jgi:3-hydroxymyristoyl/3-hydroxydecanoyl-(acyl carrier protein) dehydratase